MKKLCTLFLLLTTLVSFSQKAIFVKPKWEKNQKIQLTASKFATLKNDTLNQISNFKINIQLTILDADKTGYTAQIIYSDLQKNFNHTQLDAETIVLHHLQNLPIKVKLSTFGKPLGIINLNQVDTHLEKGLFKLAENPETKAISDFGFNVISQKKYAENYILKMLKVYCISTEREVQPNKNYSFFKAHENSRAGGVVSFKAHYVLNTNPNNPNLHDLTFNINYDKTSLDQLAQNLKFTNPNYNNITFMRGQNYNLIDLNSGQIFKATDTWDVKYQNFTEKVTYQIDLLNQTLPF